MEKIPDWVRFCYFPKYKGMWWKNIVKEDRRYVEVILATQKLPSILSDYLIRLLKNG